jgi:glycosyltransferase involved in cell wall biosynthesis
MIDENSPDFSVTPVSPDRPRFSYDYPNDGYKPNLTIITTFFNESKDFNETACSVLQQSFQRWEWIIINDCSDHVESLVILDKYRKSDSRIKVIDHPKRLGIYSSRNEGFQTANSEYVFLLDSNNLLEPTALEKLLWFIITHHEYSFVNSYIVDISRDTPSLNKNGFHTPRRMLQGNILHSNALFRKDVYFSAGGYNVSAYKEFSDWEFWTRCVYLGYSGYTIPEFLLWNRNLRNYQNNSFVFADYFLEKKLKMLYPKAHGVFTNPRISEKVELNENRVINKISLVNPLHKPRDKKRLLLVTAYMTMGGADKFNLDIVRELSKNGWEVSVATTWDYPEISWECKFAQITPDIFVFPKFLPISTHLDFLCYLIGSRQPDFVLITNSEFAYLALPYLRNTFPQTIIVDCCHAEEEWKNGGFPGFSLRNQRYLDLTIVTTNHLKTWMIGRGADGTKIEVCYTSIDSSDWKPDLVQKLKTKDELSAKGSILILYAARLSAEKQPAVFARVMKNLKRSGIQFKAIVAGDGPYYKWLKSYIHKHRLARQVIMLGAVLPDRMHKLMNASDIFFLPSKREGIAVTIFEAMASGLAVVGANVGGQKELVIENVGVLVNTTDEDQDVKNYTEALFLLIRNSKNREELAEKARSHVVRNFPLDKMTVRFQYLLDRATALHFSQLYKYDNTESINYENLELYINNIRQWGLPEYHPVKKTLMENTIQLISSARKRYKTDGLFPTFSLSIKYIISRIRQRRP